MKIKNTINRTQMIMQYLASQYHLGYITRKQAITEFKNFLIGNHK